MLFPLKNISSEDFGVFRFFFPLPARRVRRPQPSVGNLSVINAIFVGWPEGAERVLGDYDLRSESERGANEK